MGFLRAAKPRLWVESDSTSVWSQADMLPRTLGAIFATVVMDCEYSVFPHSQRHD
jgi:hypothetical protein